MGHRTGPFAALVASGRVQAKKVSFPSGTHLEFEPEDLKGLKGKLLPEILDGAGKGVTQAASQGVTLPVVKL